MKSGDAFGSLLQFSGVGSLPLIWAVRALLTATRGLVVRVTYRRQTALLEESVMIPSRGLLPGG
jgi:hypothetical protein